MPRKILTDAFLKNGIPSVNSQSEFWDLRTPGFGVRVSPGGTRTWVVLGRKRAGERWVPARVTIGRYPETSLADARIKAHEVLAALKAGQTPREIRAAKERAVDQRQSLTIEKIATDFIGHQRRLGRRAWHEAEGHLNRDVIPAWTGRSIEDICKRDIRNVLDTIMARGSPYAANRTLATISRMFSWAISAGIVEASPAIGVEKPAEEKTRDRALSNAEIIVFWKISALAGWPFGPFFRLLLLTGQRRGELAGSRWSDLDLRSAAPKWTISAGLAKNRKEHVVPLSPSAVATFKALPGYADESNELIFSTNGRTAISGFSRAMERLRSAMDEAAKRKHEQFQIHDLRRTMATGLAALGTAPHVVEAVLNHKSGQIRGVAAVYNRYDFASEMRHSLNEWAAHIVKLTKKSSP